MILHFRTPVNILRANTGNIGGVAKGDMILGLPEDIRLQDEMEQYLQDHGLEVQEVEKDV